MATVVESEGKHRVAGRQQRQVGGHVGLRSGVRLHVGVFCPVEALSALNRERLDLVDDSTATVVALARIALGVLVRGDAADCFHHGWPREVLGGDQLELVALAVQLAVEEAGNRGVDYVESSSAEGVEGDIVGGHSGILRGATFPASTISACQLADGVCRPHMAGCDDPIDPRKIAVEGDLGVASSLQQSARSGGLLIRDLKHE